MDKYAVIFVNQRTTEDKGEYDKTANRMVDLAKKQKGYLGIHSVRGEDGKGITISYWDSHSSILAWKENLEHSEAREKGRTIWYEEYILQICKVEKEYDWKLKG